MCEGKLTWTDREDGQVHAREKPRTNLSFPQSHQKEPTPQEVCGLDSPALWENKFLFVKAWHLQYFVSNPSKLMQKYHGFHFETHNLSHMYLMFHTPESLISEK
jgi:hypothetical protein